jgi:hypothetical protein
MSSHNGSGQSCDPVAYGDVRYHEGSGTYQVAFRPSRGTATEAVVVTVAKASGTDPLELPPLASVLDPDALDALCGASVWNVPTDGIRVSFRYADHDVTVGSHGTVVVEPLR